MKNRLRIKLLLVVLLSSITILSCNNEPKIKCINCNGKGQTWSDFGYKQCKLCDGTGKTTKSEEERFFKY